MLYLIFLPNRIFCELFDALFDSFAGKLRVIFLLVPLLVSQPSSDIFALLVSTNLQACLRSNLEIVSFSLLYLLLLCNKF